jgi:hypothetical protein
MVISDEHRYVFIEIPLTASWSTRRALCDFYGGRPILHKHAWYDEFRRIATPQQRDYFVFAAVRNPLDAAVSHYAKLAHSDGDLLRNDDAIRDNRADYSHRAAYRWVQETGADFAAYLRRYHRWSAGSMLELSERDVDHVMRFERLQEDFDAVLRRLGIEPSDEIPQVNRTQGRKRDFTAYYTPDVIPHAQRVFGPYMRRWGYAFPAEWGTYQPTWTDELRYRLVRLVRTEYMKRVRYSRSGAGFRLRQLRSRI